MKTTFIYALKELLPGEFFSTKIRYIGKANDPYERFEAHCRTKEKNHRGNWIRSLPTKGASLQLEILDELPDIKSIWEFWEREYIRVFRAIGFNLVNGTSGGDGMHNPTAEVRAKMGNKNCSLETRLKMRKAKLGKNLPYETCARMRAKIHKNNTSGFAGVCRRTGTKKWRASVQFGRKRIAVGSFYKIEDAVFARALAVSIR